MMSSWYFWKVPYCATFVKNAFDHFCNENFLSIFGRNFDPLNISGSKLFRRLRPTWWECFFPIKSTASCARTLRKSLAITACSSLWVVVNAYFACSDNHLDTLFNPSHNILDHYTSSIRTFDDIFVMMRPVTL